MQFDIKSFIFESFFQQVRIDDKNHQIEMIIVVLAQTPDTPSITSIDKNRSFQADDSSEHRLMTINEIINGSVRSELFSFDLKQKHRFRLFLE